MFFTRLATFVTRHRMLVVLGWLLAVVGVQSVAPRWERSFTTATSPTCRHICPASWASSGCPRRFRGSAARARSWWPSSASRADDQRRRAGRLRRGAPHEESVRLPRGWPPPRDWPTKSRRCGKTASAGGSAMMSANAGRTVLCSRPTKRCRTRWSWIPRLADYWDGRVAADPSLQSVASAATGRASTTIARCWPGGKGEDERRANNWTLPGRLDPSLRAAGDEVRPGAGRSPAACRRLDVARQLLRFEARQPRQSRAVGSPAAVQ